MSAPFLVVRQSGKGGKESTPQQYFMGYLGRLLKMIPGEVIGLYLVGSGFIPTDQTVSLVIWSIICVAAVVAIRAVGTKDSKHHTVWIQVGIASIAFVIWLYNMGGPFLSYGIHVPYIGSLLVLAWSFFIPLIYPGVDDKDEAD